MRPEAADDVNVAQNVGFGIVAFVMIFAALCVVSTRTTSCTPRCGW